MQFLGTLSKYALRITGIEDWLVVCALIMPGKWGRNVPLYEMCHSLANGYCKHDAAQALGRSLQPRHVQTLDLRLLKISNSLTKTVIMAVETERATYICLYTYASKLASIRLEYKVIFAVFKF